MTARGRIGLHVAAICAAKCDAWHSFAVKAQVERKDWVADLTLLVERIKQSSCWLGCIRSLPSSKAYDAVYSHSEIPCIDMSHEEELKFAGN